MNTDKAYEILDLVADKNDVDLDDISLLIQLSKHNDPEIRSYVAELIVLANDSKAENALIKMLLIPMGKNIAECRKAMV